MAGFWPMGHNPKKYGGVTMGVRGCFSIMERDDSLVDGEDSVSPSTLKDCADQVSAVSTVSRNLQLLTGDMQCASLFQDFHHICS